MLSPLIKNASLISGAFLLKQITLELGVFLILSSNIAIERLIWYNLKSVKFSNPGTFNALLKTGGTTMEWKDDFDKQWAKAKQFPGGQVYDLTPPPARLKSGIPILLVEGIMPNLLATKQVVARLFQKGRRVICVHTPHGATRGVDESSPGFQGPQWRKAVAVLRALNDKRVGVLTCIAYSEGSVVWHMMEQYLAAHHQQMFRTVLLVEPAGLIQESPWTLGKRAWREKGEEEQRQRHHPHEWWWVPNETDWRYYARTPIRTWREMKSMARVDIRPILASVRERLSLGVMLGERSTTYPLYLQQRALREKGLQDIARMVSGAHHDIFLSPTSYAREMHEFLTQLESRSRY